MNDILSELKQRRVVQWLVAYLAFSWVAVQVAELMAGIFFWPSWWLQALVWLLVFGFLATAVLAWFHGKKGEQRLRGPELLLLTGILVAAGVFLAFYEFEVSPLASGTVSTANHFEEMTTRRITAGRGHDGEPAWSPDDESLVFVSMRSGNADLWVLSGNGSIRQLTDHPAEDGQPAWSPDGRRILFVSSRNHGDALDQSEFLGYSMSGDIWSVPAFGGEPSLVVNAAYNPSWHPGGSRFAFDSSREGPRRIWSAAADGSDLQMISQDESDLAAHIDPAWSPDGRWVAYARQRDSVASVIEVWVAPASGGEGLPLVRGPGLHFSPTWIDDSSIVYASDRGGAINLWQLDFDARTGTPVGAPVRLTLGAGLDIEPTVSSSGKLAYVNLKRIRNIWKAGVDPDSWSLSTAMEPVFDTDWNNFAPSFSADGRDLVYSSDQDGAENIWKLEGDSAYPERMTSGPGQKIQPQFSPDGKKIAYFSNRAGNNDIWVVPAAGGAAIQVTDSPANDINPFWSPDGREIAFVSDRSGHGEIWVMGADGSNARSLVRTDVTAHTARWSPAADWIIYTSDETGDREIWAVRPDGSESRRLTERPSSDAHPLWSPDGSEFLYLADHRVLWVQKFEGGAPVVLFDPGERIDYTQLSPDGRTLLFTRDRYEGDLWVMEGDAPAKAGESR